MILANGIVRTLDPSLPSSGAVAIAGDRVAGGVGTHEAVLPTPDRVDLRGRCVIPGLADAHVHFPTWALALREVALDGAASRAEALDRLGRHPRRDGWIRGSGWRDADWDEPPTRAALDGVTGETPASLWAKDRHSLWLNSAALARARGDLEVRGGVVERDPDGEPTGILREQAAWAFEQRFVHVPEKEWVEATRAGIRLAHERGVTSVHDKDGRVGAASIFGRIREHDGLTMRVWQSLPHERVHELAALGLRSGFGDGFLRLGYLKAFMDGTLGSRTAWMLDGSGVVITDEDELAEIIRTGAAAGWPVAVHAIGDAANRAALNAFAATRDVWQAQGLRPRVEHCQCLAPEDVPRFAALGVACSVQFSHAPSDRDLADAAWSERSSGAYAFRSLLETGAVVANGSDAPVEELDPLAGIRAGVRRTSDERAPWHAEQALTVAEALAAATVAPAWLTGDERRRGRLLPGFLADLVVLTRDPVTCPADELESVEVVATMVAGRWVANPPPWD